MPERRDVTWPHDQQGAVLVEAAIGFSIVFFAVLAICEAGLLFSTHSTTNNAARAGARLAAATYAPAGSKAAAADAIRQEVEAELDALTGFGTPQTLWIHKATAAADPCATSCFRFVWNPSAGHFGLEASSPGWPNPDACPSDGTVDSIVVRVVVAHRAATGVLDDRTAIEHTTMRLEPLPTHQCV
jgi:hypothetical protein